MSKHKPLKLDDCDSIAGLFVDDLIAYHKAGGHLRNLTAKKVYKKLRGQKDNTEEFSIENVRAEIEDLKQNIARLDLSNPNNEEIVDLCYDVALSDEDHNYLLEKLGLNANGKWTYEQQLEYIDEALKIKTIREGEGIVYLKLTKHDSEELFDVDELLKEKT